MDKLTRLIFISNVIAICLGRLSAVSALAGQSIKHMLIKEG